jgi:hypothetical protein
MFLGEPLRHAWRTVRGSKRMLLLVGFLDLLVCLPPAAYYFHSVHDVAGRRADALEIAQRHDADFFADLRARPGFDDTLTVLCGVSFVLFFFLRPFVMGGYVGLAASRKRARFTQFAREAGASYWKFLRLALLAAAAAYLLSIAAKPLLTQVDEWARLRPEPTAVKYGQITNFLVFAAFTIVSVIFDYARVGARVVRRPGVLGELGRSALFVLQHPARTLALAALWLGLEWAVVVALGWFVLLADTGGLTASVTALVLFQIVVTLREALRLFHIAGAWRMRSDEAGEERRGPEVIAPEPDTPDVLRDPLPWNLRG